MNFAPIGNKILILSDAPEALSGLARVGRDIATLLSSMPQFQVAYLGKQAVGKRKFPWMQYSFPDTPLDPWGETYLRYVLQDFAGGDPCIVFSNWDASRLDWLAAWNSREMNIQKWGYFPVDSEGPAGGQPQHIEKTIAAFDRTLAASKWGMQVGGTEDWIPHGILGDKFLPYLLPHDTLGWSPVDVHLGCVMTNQQRKDWPVAFECAAHLKAKYGNRFKFWCHIDVPVRHWHIGRLMADYGVEAEVTTELTDTQLAMRYSACDCTILPSATEGFGFTIAESMACGTPCVATNYGGGVELNFADMLVDPSWFIVYSTNNVRRAVLHGGAFAAVAERAIENKRTRPLECRDRMTERVAHLEWDKLKHVWKRWFLKGIGQNEG